jgi:DNA-directed RNA polymerase subunit RPC12/RpoP
MATTVFDAGVRTVECKQCGAPFEMPSVGGQHRCSYCNAVNVIATRASDFRARGASAMADDVARMSRLQAQLAHPVTGHAYDLQRPPVGWTDQAANSHLAFDRLQREWGKLKWAASGSPAPEEQRHLLWLSFRLADIYARTNRPLQKRAVLETALDLLSDAGHRHLVRCRLARESISLGDLAAAEAWLQECDPAPELVDLDTAYRLAMAELRHAQRNPHGMLSVIGAQPGDVPIHASAQRDLGLLRAHALEVLGQQEVAVKQLRELAGTEGIDTIERELERRNLAPAVQQRLREARRNGIRAQIAQRGAEQAALPTGLRAFAGPLAALPIIAGLLWIPVAISRCTFDADPLLGAPGYALCPKVCPDCHGPWRIYTPWSHNGGEHSTNGSRYFCPSDTNGMDELSTAQWESDWHKYQQYELDTAPAGSTYLILMILAFPLVPLGATRVHLRSRRTRARLNEEMSALATSIGEIVPEFRSKGSYTALLSAIAWVLVPALVAMVLVVVEFLF